MDLWFLMKLLSGMGVLLWMLWMKVSDGERLMFVKRLL